MRISDWSSDVCSSDLVIGPIAEFALERFLDLLLLFLVGDPELLEIGRRADGEARAHHHVRLAVDAAAEMLREALDVARGAHDVLLRSPSFLEIGRPWYRVRVG